MRWHVALVLALRRQSLANFCEFRACHVYMVRPQFKKSWGEEEEKIGVQPSAYNKQNLEQAFYKNNIHTQVKRCIWKGSQFVGHKKFSGLLGNTPSRMEKSPYGQNQQECAAPGTFQKGWTFWFWLSIFVCVCSCLLAVHSPAWYSHPCHCVFWLLLLTFLADLVFGHLANVFILSNFLSSNNVSLEESSPISFF